MELPLFPLPKTILLPGVVMPLHFFEPRYVQMIEEVMESEEKQIVMSRLLCKDEIDYFLNPEFEPIGCIGEVVNHVQNDNGTHDIVLVGLERARLTEAKSSDHRLYRCVKAHPLPFPDISDEQENWLKNKEEAIIELLKETGQGDAVTEVFNKWHEKYLTARALLNIFIFSLIDDTDQLQQILVSDDAEQPINIIRQWLKNEL